MIDAVYRCSSCTETTRLRFAEDYRPIMSWLMSCWKCKKYSLHVLQSVQHNSHFPSDNYDACALLALLSSIHRSLNDIP